MIFGEFFPPPGSVPAEAVPHFQAFLAEFLGTALLAFVIFALTDDRNPFKSAKATPVLIGLTLTLLIGFFAPLSMGGFNPDRDFAFAEHLRQELLDWRREPSQIELPRPALPGHMPGRRCDLCQKRNSIGVGFRLWGMRRIGAHFLRHVCIVEALILGL